MLIPLAFLTEAVNSGQNSFLKSCWDFFRGLTSAVNLTVYSEHDDSISDPGAKAAPTEICAYSESKSDDKWRLNFFFFFWWEVMVTHTRVIMLSLWQCWGAAGRCPSLARLRTTTHQAPPSPETARLRAGTHSGTAVGRPAVGEQHGGQQPWLWSFLWENVSHLIS